MRITVTEGLSELKLLKSRIVKAIEQLIVIMPYQAGKSPAGYKAVSDFEAVVKASEQKVSDLIARRDAIKTAIVVSNALATVNISGKAYSVAAAIEFKSSLVYKEMLLATMVKQYQSVTARVERDNQAVQERLDSLINTTFGKEGKTDPSVIEAMTQTFMASNEVRVSDPLSLRSKIDQLNDELSAFKGSVDVQLSISNSTTFIEV